MNQKRFPEEFKIEAVRQIVKRGHPIAEVSARLVFSTHRLYNWMKEQQLPPRSTAGATFPDRGAQHLK
jgi:transposase